MHVGGEFFKICYNGRNVNQIWPKKFGKLGSWWSRHLVILNNWFHLFNYIASCFPGQIFFESRRYFSRIRRSRVFFPPIRHYREKIQAKFWPGLSRPFWCHFSCCHSDINWPLQVEVTHLKHFWYTVQSNEQFNIVKAGTPEPAPPFICHYYRQIKIENQKFLAKRDQK